MKNVIIIVVLAAIAGGGYFYYTGQQKAELEQAQAAAAEKVAAEAKAAEEAAAKTAEETAAKEAEDAANAAAKLVEEAAQKAADEAAAALENAETVVTDALSSAGDLLNPDNFDIGKVSELIDGSDLGAGIKTTLKTAVDQAKDNPELLKIALEQVKSALGL